MRVLPNSRLQRTRHLASLGGSPLNRDKLAGRMGIDAFLDTETGEPLGELSDEHSLLSRMIQRGGFDSTVCLRFLDPWGDATFNHLQVPSLIVELRAARERVDPPTREHLDALVLLADRVKERPHLYLKFIGD